MAAGPGAPSVVEEFLIGLRADPRVDEGDGRVAHSRDAGNSVLSDLAQIRDAARDDVWARLADQVLESGCDEPGGGAGHAQAEPAGEPFPELAAPDEGFRDGFWDRGAGDEEERDDEDYGCWGTEADDDDDGDGDGVRVVGVAELGVGEGDGAFVGGDFAEADADGCCSSGGLGLALVRERG